MIMIMTMKMIINMIMNLIYRTITDKLGLSDQRRERGLTSYTSYFTVSGCHTYSAYSTVSGFYCSTDITIRRSLNLLPSDYRPFSTGKIWFNEVNSNATGTGLKVLQTKKDGKSQSFNIWMEPEDLI